MPCKLYYKNCQTLKNKVKISFSYILILVGFLISPSTLASEAIIGEIVRQPLNITAIAMFLLFVSSTLLITWWAAKRTHSRKDFYAAGGGLPAWQNGVAISGDFMSAATFLGISSALYFNGLDALTLVVGALGGWPIILFLISERLRNLGKYTFIDVLSYRLDERPIRLVASIGSLSVLCFYLIGQLVGAGKLIQLLFGLDYIIAVSSVSTLMILYVSFGGMLATTWVQFIKAILLVLGGTIISFLLLQQFNFDLEQVFKSAVDTHPRGIKLFAPGGWLKDPVSVFAVGLTTLLGFIGLPHILMRMFTVKDAKEARKSAFYAISIIGYFNLLIIIIGFGAVSLIMFNPDYHDAAGNLIGGRNMVVLHLTHFLGGNLLLGFISAVTFATILAVVSGLTLAAAATIAHDLYALTLFADKATEKSEMLLSRLSVIGIGLLGIFFGLAFEKQNIVFITNMALSVAASVNAPILLAAMYWRGLTTRGAIAGCLLGLVSSVGLIILGPQVWVDVIGMDKPFFPYVYPTVISAPLAFLALWFFSISDHSARATLDREGFDKQLIESETGLGISNAVTH
ncbi:MAG: cation/acetate symporter [Gammaproteobacteria bacterium]|jgi:cation/acetate symporter